MASCVGSDEFKLVRYKRSKGRQKRVDHLKDATIHAVDDAPHNTENLKHRIRQCLIELIASEFYTNLLQMLDSILHSSQNTVHCNLSISPNSGNNTVTAENGNSSAEDFSSASLGACVNRHAMELYDQNKQESESDKTGSSINPTREKKQKDHERERRNYGTKNKNVKDNISIYNKSNLKTSNSIDNSDENILATRTAKEKMIDTIAEDTLNSQRTARRWSQTWKWQSEIGTGHLMTEESEAETVTGQMETKKSEIKTGIGKMKTEEHKTWIGTGKMKTEESGTATRQMKSEKSETETGTEYMKTEKSKTGIGTGHVKTEESMTVTVTGEMKTEEGEAETLAGQIKTEKSETETWTEQMKTEESKTGTETGHMKTEEGGSKTGTGQPSACQLQLLLYGVGNFATCLIARYQLALFLALRQHLQIKPPYCLTYDPRFTETEKQILQDLDCNVISYNEEGKRRVKDWTLVLMPHCGKALFNNLLWANWSPWHLQRLIVLGNSFSQMRESIPNRHLDQQLRYVANIKPHTVEQPLLNNFRHMDIFNDLSLHHFPKNLLQQVPSELWSHAQEPAYNPTDVEIILRKNKSS